MNDGLTHAAAIAREHAKSLMIRSLEIKEKPLKERLKSNARAVAEVAKLIELEAMRAKSEREE